MVNRERIQLYVDALLSGEYQQGFKGLSDNKGCDCAAGVACKVAIKNGLKIETKPHSDTDLIAYNGNAHCLPHAVQEWYGFDSRFIRLSNGYYVTELNDRNKCSFPVIAEAIKISYLT